MIFLFWLKKESWVEEIFDRLLLGNGYLHWPIGNGAILQGLHHHTRYIWSACWKVNVRLYFFK
jgi:hypothetical protein